MPEVPAARGYLDYQSGAPVDPRVVEEMLPYMTERFGNPAVLHSDGDPAREAVETARARVASLIGGEPKEIVFTSGATEASNLALKGVARRMADKGRHIVSSVIEHRSVITPLKYLEKQGFEVTYLPVDSEATVDPAAVKEALRDDTILVSIMTANGEVGTIQPVGEIATLVKDRGVLFHTDIVQAQAWVPVDVSTLPFDLVTLSSNDIYGPKGVGALYVRKGTRLEAVLHGGGQERGLRSGTENVPGLVGFGKAAELAADEMASDVERVRSLRDRLFEGILGSIEDAEVNGSRQRRLPNNVNIRFKYIEGESLILSLDMEGIRASTGSACSVKTLEPSYVQIAMGVLHEEAHGSLQLTLGRWSTGEDVDRTLETLPGIIERLRAMSAWKPGMTYDRDDFGHDHDGGSGEE
ncbi:MAG: aminotransferase class V-fold PLP-dependent enzyme [Candidatus Eisenbacteria bacterium]|nr:aminotransferase class V-fold PLP-dependent enzyme [Candidatus Eisenbacteria bacterium]